MRSVVALDARDSSRVASIGELASRSTHRSIAAARVVEHRSKLNALALALLDRETLDGPDAYAAAGIERLFPDEDPRETAPTPA